MSEPRLLRNAIKTPDGTILESHNRHDYIEYEDTISGETYIVDGGLDYIRRSVNLSQPEVLDLYENDPHEKIREGFSWGSYGPNGDQPLHYIFLKDMTTEHINAIIDNGYARAPFIRKVFGDELEYRND